MTDPRALVAAYLKQRKALGTNELVLPESALAALSGQAVGAEPEVVRADVPEATLETAEAKVAAPSERTEPAVYTPFDELERTASVCTRCKLCETRTQVVFGEGNRSARLVVVGEAPGADEDRSGRPFVGKAGRLLDVLLQSIGFPRESVYICNVLKCRPPKNRNPTPEEVTSCSPYLLRQLELIEPGAILAVGTFPAQTLLETGSSISRLRGSVHQYQGIPLVPTYHPAALLRNPGWVRPVWEDLQRLRRIIDG